MNFVNSKIEKGKTSFFLSTKLLFFRFGLSKNLTSPAKFGPEREVSSWFSKPMCTAFCSPAMSTPWFVYSTKLRTILGPFAHLNVLGSALLGVHSSAEKNKKVLLNALSIKIVRINATKRKCGPDVFQVRWGGGRAGDSVRITLMIHAHVLLGTCTLLHQVVARGSATKPESRRNQK